MDHLMRDNAPVSSRAWNVIETEITDTLTHTLVGRQLFDVSEPCGWETGSIHTGRVHPVKGKARSEACVCVRDVMPMVEIRVPFKVSRAELDSLARGATKPRLDSVVQAATRAAAAEDDLVLGGLDAANVRGVIGSAPSLSLPEDKTHLPSAVAEAIGQLRSSGVEGPYALALQPALYDALNEATAGGYPVVKHVARLVDAPIIWAPALTGGLVTSCRGGDFRICLGSDFAVGYRNHDADHVEFSLEEVLTFENRAPDASVVLRSG